MFMSTRLAALCAAATIVVGCAANQTAQSTMTETPKAVACEKCETTWVKLPIEQKGRVVAYSTRKSMECPDCISAVNNFFATGKLQHACATCGPDAMKICESH